MPEFTADSRHYPQGALCEGAAGNITEGRFVTTIHAMNSGVLKLSLLTPITKVYRGAAGMTMPKSLMEPDACGPGRSSDRAGHHSAWHDILKCASI